MSATLQSPRTTVRRLPQRADYDRAAVEAILDEALICHVGYVVDGSPVVIPTIHWRDSVWVFLGLRVGDLDVASRCSSAAKATERSRLEHCRVHR